ncbi:MAG: hypothetical protein CMP59_06710 [Flavobacteriales bacterium]|nr:hypothetical protein [Flavobacteriales bacterium]|tara:strand:+ start:369 stop:1616 length:1248 start_codon:yes stop_codon:yes gene_type:complete
MNEVIIHFIQLNLILLGAFLIWKYGLRDKVSAPFQRFFLLSILPLIALSYLPQLQFAFFESTVEPIRSTINEINIYPATQEGLQHAVAWDWIMIIYFLVSSFFIAKLAYSCYQIFALRRTSRSANGHYILSNSNQAFSFFGSIFIGANIPEKDKETILAHEEVHKNELHSLDILFFGIMEAIFWFLPPIFLFKKAIKEVHEYQADEIGRSNSDRYIEVLLNQALSTTEFKLAHSFNKQHLKKRIMKIKNKSTNPIQKPILILAGIAFLAMISFHQSLRSNPSAAESSFEQLASLGDETKAEFPGGQEALIKFIIENVKYPKGLESSGTVYVEFVIDENGKCNSFKVLKTFDAECAKAAVSALEKMPNWKAATKDGKNVKSKMTIPIRFQPEKSMNKGNGFQNSPNLFQQELETKG